MKMDKRRKIALVHAGFARTIEDPTWWGFEEKHDMIVVTSPQGERKEVWFVCDCGHAYAACECPERENRKSVQVAGIPLENEYGSTYGTLWIVFARRTADAQMWIHQNLDGSDGEPYYNDRGLWDQCRVEIVTRYDDDGSISRSPWWTLIEAFADGNVTESALRDIADIK